MKKILPILIAFLSIFFILSPFVQQPVFAQDAPEEELEGKWVSDPEVTFTGKTAARANDFLNWTLRNYDWVSIQSGDTDPLRAFWLKVLLIPASLIALFVLVAAFIMIITRGKNLTVMRFLPRLTFIIVLMFLSFSLVQFLYTLGDIFQGFFLELDQDTTIQSSDLLYIAFDYESFTGFRQLGEQFEESAFISLLLVKLTAITYYVMTGVLLVRKVILWFLLIVSSIFPLLLFYKPLRNSAKIWIGEFFRWLLYAPLFALFLRGLVEMWRDRIPLPFNFQEAGSVPGTDIVYPTAINILLGGPGQTISIDNSVNLQDTFALYVFALIMLWVVILLPFLLLKIFLDYLNNFSFSQSQTIQQLNRRFNPFQPPPGRPSPPTAPPDPSKPQSSGIARALPFLRKQAGTARKISTHTATNTSTASDIRSRINTSTDTRERSTSDIRNRQTTSTYSSSRTSEQVTNTNEILKTVNVSIPKMRDIAKFESTMLSRDTTKVSEVTNVSSTLQKIANPASITSIQDRQKFTEVHEKLKEQQRSGNKVASNILSTTTNIAQSGIAGITKHADIKIHISQILQNIAKPEDISSPIKKRRYQTIKTQLTEKKQSGDRVAAKVLESSQKITSATSETQKQEIAQATTTELQQAQSAGDQTATTIMNQAQIEQQSSKPHLPVMNQVQQVSLEEYEEVRKMWAENYKNLEPPKTVDGAEPTREEWIKTDMQNIDETIALLTSPMQEKIDEGMQRVSNILPFLLIGGFSKAEVVAYLKAKKEAGKQTIETLEQKQEEEDTLLDREEGTKEQQKKMEMKAELPTSDEKPEEKK